MSQGYRLPTGGRIDRASPLNFSFDGRRYQGFAGDTLASALLANGVHFVGRSFKYHRPRGIVGDGPEEPNALVGLDTGGRAEPNTRATQIALYEGLAAHSQNNWPSLRWDLGAINDLLSPIFPAGFYYKTFMWPAAFWPRYEAVIRQAAGLGRAPKGRDPDGYMHRHAHCDVLVVGAGVAGIAAARAAGEAGARVILIDERPGPGGRLRAEDSAIGDEPGAVWLDQELGILDALPNVTRVDWTTVTGYYDQNFLIALERLGDHRSPNARGPVRQRLWKIRAKHVVLATGAIERPLVFRGNDRPGVMLAGAVSRYVREYAVLPGRSVLLHTDNDSAYDSALALNDAGASVTIADLRPAPQGPRQALAREAGITIHAGTAVTRTTGRHRIDGAVLRALDASGRDVAGSAISVSCDLIAMSGGWTPTVHLFSQSRGKLQWSDAVGAFVPGETTQATSCAGACNGVSDATACRIDGENAGGRAAEACGFEASPPRTRDPRQESRDTADRKLWIVPSGAPIGKGGKHFVDFQNDVTAADLALANREGYRSIEHLKRYTTTGMGTDQGKTSNIVALSILAELRETNVPDVGHTTYRPPYTPITFGAIAGPHVGPLFDPERHTSMHAWHRENGAVFEDVGQWKRPRFYPKAGETMELAVARECRAARQGLAIMDAGTLGKIDIQGPDAVRLLNMVYTNAWDKLGVGRSRYGLMLNENGMVFDDGVTTRLGPQHFHMTTTTGGAAHVLDWLEEWLQTEWTNWKVYCTSVTEQWAVASLCGPRCREFLAPLTDIDLDPEAFPFMTVRDGLVVGIPARVYRVSFTGELSFEVNVPARRGAELWSRLMDAGAAHDICPYGTEAMHVLRAERGYIIVGQETDGTTTPFDLGMDWIVSKKKDDFLGKRSLSRPDTARSDRKQLVGLLTDDPSLVLPEGAHAVAEPRDKPPMPMLGHVTSSYFSPTLDRSIALALIRGGRDRVGDTLHVPLLDGRRPTVRVVPPIFYDESGGRARG